MEMREGHVVLKKLKEGAVIAYQGVRYMIDGDGTVAVGDLYIGARNTVNVLTCKSIDERGWIYPVEKAYPFDIHECVRVIALPPLTALTPIKE